MDNTEILYKSLTLFTTAFVYRCSGIVTDLRPKLGGAVNFSLPPFSQCGKYNMTNPNNEQVFGIFNSTYAYIGSLYTSRGIYLLLANGAGLFTLHHIKDSDAGIYRTVPSGSSPEECWHMYNLTVKSIDWTNWNQWSPCSTTCGTGTRNHNRICLNQETLHSVPDQHCDGASFEQSQCTLGDCAPHTSQNPRNVAYQWTEWDHWSTCRPSCGVGSRTRVRQCHDSRALVENIKCGEHSSENERCVGTECEEVPTGTTYEWSPWNAWSSCSQSCGVGYTTRVRQCLDILAIVENIRCGEHSSENVTCRQSVCEVKSNEQDRSSQISERTVEVPLSVIVGTSCGLFILILTVVIVGLVIKLKRRNKRPVKTLPDLSQGARTVRNKSYRKKSSVISQNLNSTHVYDEIDDNDVDVKSDKRVSVLTIDNPYVVMPRSATPSGTDMPTGNPEMIVEYNNVQETVFVFDNSNQLDVFKNRKVSNAYQNKDMEQPQNRGNGMNNLRVPRNMSVDSTGYLMPGNTLERAERRKKTYVKT